MTTAPPSPIDQFEEVKQRYTDQEIALIDRAYAFASAAHKDQLRMSGTPHIYHCLEVAIILTELRMDFASICAGLLHDVLEDTDTAYETLKAEFPSPIPELVEGVTKISTLRFRSAREEQVENLRKMILAMARDIRVIIIKLSDRLHNMRTLQYLPLDKQLSISRDTLDIYAQLANRLGMTRIRSELEDLAMPYLHPEDYREITQNVDRKKAQRDVMIQRSIAYLRDHMERHNISATIQGRSKHFYSIFQKMQKQHLSFDEIYDLSALRIVTDSLEQCYDILGLVHSVWRPIPGRFKDYIALPKENMYQSIHTTVVGLGGEITEIQIRTSDMHKVAEEGIAAHWLYKEGRTQEEEIDQKLLWLRQLTEWIKDIRDPSDFLNALKEDVFADIVFCFSPKGDVVELPKDSTPIDFAYHIHTEIGEHCIGARVNKKYVPLKYTLYNGDMVEIITSKTGHPSQDWLDIVKTSRARNKIRHYFKSKNYETDIQLGKDLLWKAIRAKNLTITQAEIPDTLAPHLRAFRANSFEELLAEIGFGSVIAGQVVAKLTPEPQKPEPAKPSRARRRSTPGVVIAGVQDPLVRFAGCCSPIPGDPIVGFVTRGRGVSIHKEECASLRQIIAQSGQDKSRLIPTQWDVNQPVYSKVLVKVVSRDRTGLLKDLTSVISSMNLMILGSHSKSYTQKGQAILKFQILVENANQINDLLNRLKNVNGVISLTRTLRHNY